jgi:hypothetical protein
MVIVTKEQQSKRQITPQTLAENPELVYKQIDKLIQKLEVSPLSFVETIALPYTERCIKKNPEYEIEQLKLENERLRKIVSSQGVDPGAENNYQLTTQKTPF